MIDTCTSLSYSLSLTLLHILSFICPLIPSPPSPLPYCQPGLVAQREEWTQARHRHMHEINSFRCHRQPMYGSDLVHTILSLSRQDPKKLSPSPLSSSSVLPWLWVGSLACQLLQTGARPEDGGLGSLLLSQCLRSYEHRASLMEGTIRRLVWVTAVSSALGMHALFHSHHTLII